MSRPLATTEVLLLDCQTTGANPARGQVIEIAWCRTSAAAIRAGAPPPVVTHLVALEEGSRVPRRIAALTGITAADLADAPAAGEISARLRDALADGPDVVAHVARFERAFVDDLRTRHGDAAPSPLSWICTHEIVCRLLPGLPHRGLKAVAGHLGHVVSEGKRAGDHVRATCAVWAGVVDRLAHAAGVRTFAELRAWTAATSPARRVGHDFAVKRVRRLALPDAPGVYRMLGHAGQVLYVGKAASLRRRVNSYFQKRRHAAPRTKEMLAQVADVDVRETATALEAALEECDAIKAIAPPYNVALRGRGVEPVFATRDLSAVSAAADETHRLGPLPGAGLPATWHALTRLLRDRSPGDEETFRSAFGLPDRAALDLDVARDGLAAFRAEHLPGETTAPLPRRLLGLGTRAWREHREALAAAAEADAADDGEPDDEAGDDPDVEAGDEGPREPWTPSSPEQVVRLLVGTASHGAHLVRRGRWLRQLTESTIVWRPPARDAAAPWRLLTVAEGRVDTREDVPAGTRAPRPPGHARTAVERGGAFDVATYDRLRILTTELRRIVAADAHVEVRLGPRHRLDRDALARRLFWL